MNEIVVILRSFLDPRGEIVILKPILSNLFKEKDVEIIYGIEDTSDEHPYIQVYGEDSSIVKKICDLLWLNGHNAHEVNSIYLTPKLTKEISSSLKQL